MMRAAQRETADNFGPIGEELHDDLDSLPAPRDTDRLLSSLFTVKLRGLRLQSGIFRPPQAIYGRYLNEGTGVFGLTGRPIVPAPGKVLSWITNSGFTGKDGKAVAAGTRIYRKSSQGSGKHKGWWDRWVALRAPLAIKRGWSRDR